MEMSRKKLVPPEIIEAILLRSQPKSIGRFKSVSKTWNILISEPRFIKAHLLIHHRHTKLLALSTSLYSIQLTPNHHLDDIPATGKELLTPLLRRWKKIMGSCNGLVLARDVNEVVFLMNPTTHDLFELPIIPFPKPKSTFRFKYGFGYVSSTDDYKVVCILFSDGGYTPRVSLCVYSLRSNTWRRLDNVGDNLHISCLIDDGVLINQHLHWLNPGYPPSVIFAFSLENEAFSEIKVPVMIENNNVPMYFYNLLDLGGKLGVLLGLKLRDCLCVMEEYGVCESWTTHCIYSYETVPGSPVCLVGGSNQDVVLGCEDKVVVYNIDKERCIDVRIEGGPTRFEIVGTYVESLESTKRFITTP